jgi:hypothetical protein
VTRNIPIEQMTSTELQRRRDKLEHRLAAPEISPTDRTRWEEELVKVGEHLDQLRKVGAIV